ncbi:hypothetical protein E2C01_011640 [Portunus trituberculatus]|uniref:Uncharacterized protein n=1 Tax=Portunus trituberculatus TaxID=210409 RepID=A0A5B7DCE1_PORTR|nr:hypothetical protein [Portunus trituberculatus]
MKLSILRRLRQLFSPLQLLTLHKDLIRLCMEYFSLSSASYFTAEMLHLFLSFIDIFMLTVLLILLTACLPSSCGLAAQGFFSSSHPYSVQPSNTRVNQYSQSFIPFTGKLWNSLPAFVFPSSYDLTSCKRGVKTFVPLF